MLLQSGLPQNVLAQIWGLADVDSDGRLSTEEFILAGHLCDLALKGEPLPPVGNLPAALVPPTLRKGASGKTILKLSQRFPQNLKYLINLSYACLRSVYFLGL